MEKCFACPNACGVDRSQNAGLCGTKEKLKIAKYAPFYFEEPPISGTNGSGAIFFSGCSLKCAFCQNYQVSRNVVGKEITPQTLADIFKRLEDANCHNINLVNPTHFYFGIIKALDIYKPNIPIVCNTHGYERVEVLKAIDGYVDVYLPDLKYFSPKVSKRYSNKENYFEMASQALQFMAQKPLIMEGGLMKSGCMVRHLILPENTVDSINVINWFNENMPKDVYFSLMAQYTPFGEIENFPELQRPITAREYNRVLDAVMNTERKNVFVQDLKKPVGTKYIPEWDY